MCIIVIIITAILASSTTITISPNRHHSPSTLLLSVSPRQQRSELNSSTALLMPRPTSRRACCPLSPSALGECPGRWTTPVGIGGCWPRPFVCVCVYLVKLLSLYSIYYVYFSVCVLSYLYFCFFPTAPLKGIPSRLPGSGLRGSGLGSTPVSRPLARQSTVRKDGGIKLLEITESPIAVQQVRGVREEMEEKVGTMRWID